MVLSHVGRPLFGARRARRADTIALAARARPIRISRMPIVVSGRRAERVVGKSSEAAVHRQTTPASPRT